MEENSSSNSRLAKNTMFLYLRMIISIVISLYTSRVILNALGAQDFGIYNVVGGTVAIVGFLSSTMSSSTSRFLSISIGKKSITDTKRIFGTSLLLHLCLAAIILIAGETLGLWFVNAKLNYPESQNFAVNVTYQLSLLATCISITQIPYDAILVAHENFKVFAYFQIASSALKLGVALLLLVLLGDKLIIYSILTFASSILMRIAYTVYVNKKYEDSRTLLSLDKTYLKELASFSGWDLLGHLGFTARQQGSNILLNIFFGAAINAASGIATTVQGVISSFSYNIITSARPQIIKAYASGEVMAFRNLVMNVSMLSMYMILLITVPVMMNLRRILSLWLVEVPDYSYAFTMCCLISGILSSLSGVYLIGIHATGAVRESSLGRNLIYLSSVVVVYLMFRRGFYPVWAYLVLIATQILTFIIDGIILHGCLPWILQLKIIMKSLAAVFVAAIVGFLSYRLFISDIDRFNELLSIILSSSFYAVIFCGMGFMFLLNSSQRKFVLAQIKRFKK